MSRTTTTTRKTLHSTAVEAETPGDDPERAAAIVRPLAEAGVTWWIEAIWDSPRTRGGTEGIRARIKQGPPRVE